MNYRLVSFLISTVVFIVSCNKAEEPPIYEEPERAYLFYSSGDRQYAGENMPLADSLVVQVFDSINNNVIPGVTVNFEVLSGGGSIDIKTSVTNKEGISYTKWELGNLTHEQTLRSEILNENDQIIKTIDFSAYAFRPNKWDEVVVEPHRYFRDLILDTINNVTLATTNSQLWKQGDNYYNWIPAKSLSSEMRPFSIEKNSKGALFVGGYQGGLDKSYDTGKTWIACNDPYGEPERNDEQFIMRIPSDDDIWLSKYGKRLYHSKDDGQSWTLDTTGLNTDSFMDDIFRLKDSTLLLKMASNECFISENDGNNWSLMELPFHTAELYVTGNDDIILMCNEDNNVVLYKSSDKGKTYEKVLRKLTPTFVTFPRHVFHEFKGSYYLMIPEYGILKTEDFETFEEIYYNSKANYFFIDHNGTLMVFQQDLEKAYYKSNAL